MSGLSGRIMDAGIVDAASRIKIGNLEAVYTLSLLGPFLGMFPALIVAYTVYLSEYFEVGGTGSDFYYNASTAGRHTDMYGSRNVHFIEPLAGPSNIAYWSSGALLFVMPFLSGTTMPNTTYGIGMNLALLAAASYTFHLDGSRGGTWQHAADRFCMYTTLVYLACAAPNGLYHAYRGFQAGPRSVPTLVSNMLAMFSIAAALSYQDRISTYEFLFPTGFIAILSNSLTMGILAARRAAEQLGDSPEETEALKTPKRRRSSPSGIGTQRRVEDGRVAVTDRVARSSGGGGGGGGRSSKGGERGRSSGGSGEGEEEESVLMQLANHLFRCKLLRHPTAFFIAQTLTAAMLQCLPFFLGMILNSASAQSYSLAVHPPSGHNLTDVDRREARKLHDVYHGLWHVLAAVFCFEGSLICVEGLTGRLDAPIGSTKEEWVACTLIVIISSLFPLLMAFDAGFWVYLHTLLAVEVGVLVFGAVALRRIYWRHMKRQARMLGESATEELDSRSPQALPMPAAPSAALEEGAPKEAGEAQVFTA